MSDDPYRLTMKLALEHLFRCPDAQASHFLVIIHDTKGSLTPRTFQFHFNNRTYISYTSTTTLVPTGQSPSTIPLPKPTIVPENLMRKQKVK